MDFSCRASDRRAGRTWSAVLGQDTTPAETVLSALDELRVEIREAQLDWAQARRAVIEVELDRMTGGKLWDRKVGPVRGVFQDADWKLASLLNAEARLLERLPKVAPVDRRPGRLTVFLRRLLGCRCSCSRNREGHRS